MAVFKVGLRLFLLAQATSPLGAAEISFFCTDALSAPGNSDLHRLHRGHSGRQRATGSELLRFLVSESSKAMLRSKGIDPD